MTFRVEFYSLLEQDRSIDRSIVESLDPIEGRDNDFDAACKLD